MAIVLGKTAELAASMHAELASDGREAGELARDENNGTRLCWDETQALTADRAAAVPH
jgi:hypothetical protein